MKISVITVSFNSAATIAHTVESFLAQDHADKEMIVIDGASDDGTVDIVKSFKSDQITLISEPDRGIYDAMNKGLRLFTGDAVGFLNSDDRFSTPTTLTKIDAALGRAGLVFGHIRYVKDHGDEKAIRLWRSKPHFPGAFRSGWIVPHPATYARRDLVNLVGEFDTNYRIAGDYDWILRALEIKKSDSKVVDEILVDMKVGGESTASIKSLWINSIEPLRIRQQWLGSGIIDYAFFAKNMKKLNQITSRYIFK